MGLESNDLARLSPAAQKQVMEKMRKPGKYKAQKTKRGKLTFDSRKEAVLAAGGGGCEGDADAGVCHESKAVPQSVRICHTGGVTWENNT